MFCPNCGANNPNGGRFCTACGGNLTDAAVDGGQSTAQGNPGPTEKPRLWNPNAIANWSLVFTPIFGAWLNRANWLTLGRRGRAGSSLFWFFVSIVAVGILLFVPEIPAGFGFIYLVIWYFASARGQTVYVRDRLDNDYRKRGWGGPLLAGLGLFALLVLALMIATGYDDYVDRLESSVGSVELPTCDDPQGIEMVQQAVRQDLAHQIGRGLMDQEAEQILSEQLEIEVNGIRSTGPLKSGGHQCAAHLLMQHGPAREVMEVIYAIEPTVTGEEFYVSVYRIE